MKKPKKRKKRSIRPLKIAKSIGKLSNFAGRVANEFREDTKKFVKNENYKKHGTEISVTFIG
ncbi:hypothetical protein ACMCNP_06890 [Candidatus Acidulodesulfobacterium sp. H_13]|uniref:hypothetical protein n=1 Tax=Candidatus Acidulodesulfobacterium sp. H_13 TaxID=3395470 RepID=UPI003AF5E691